MQNRLAVRHATHFEHLTVYVVYITTDEQKVRQTRSVAKTFANWLVCKCILVKACISILTINGDFVYFEISFLNVRYM